MLLPVQLRLNFGSGYIHREQAAACLIHRRIPVDFMKFLMSWDIWIWYSNTYHWDVAVNTRMLTEIRDESAPC